MDCNIQNSRGQRMIALTTSEPTASDLHESANLAIELGYSILRLSPGTKIPPKGTNGSTGATNNPDEVAQWYASGERWNYGIAAKGFFFVDVDVDTDHPKNEWYTKHAERLMDPPAVRTPRGGLHFLYRQPAGADLRNSTGEKGIAPKVDVRADGGYIVGPGSFVNGKVYTPLPGRELESVDSLPVAPNWLIEQQAAGRAKKAEPTTTTTHSGTIDNGQRNSTLASLGGSMRRAGMTPTAIEAGLQAENVARCNPQLPAEEVSRIATSVSRYEPAEVPEVAGEPVEFERITCSELASGDYAVEFLIGETMVAGQPLIIAGPQKVLKTSFIVDAAISLATGSPMLGQLEVPRVARVAVMTGESGLSTIQETARRIAVSKVENLADIDNLIWSPDLPRFGSSEHEDALKQFLTDDEIEVLFIDPAYLCMPGDGAGNLMSQGELIRPMAKACESVGVTMVLAHHAKKHRVTAEGSPLELSDISWAGFAEFARQWWLISRRERYEPGSGEHNLWLTVGGSAGHSALWGIDVAEGVYNPHEPRKWDVTVQPGHEAIEHAMDARSEKKANREAEKVEAKAKADREAVSNAMIRIGKAETKANIANAARMSSGRALPVLLDLIDTGDVMEATVLRSNGQTYGGYQLCEK